VRKSSLAGIAACVLFTACAGPKPTTEVYIEAGAFTLLPDTVVVSNEAPNIITAQLAINDQRKAVAVVGSECNDGIGSIRIVEQMTGADNSQIYAFDRGDKPADRLFAQLCEIRKRKLAEKSKG
jgi:hypothetical protein